VALRETLLRGLNVSLSRVTGYELRRQVKQVKAPKKTPALAAMPREERLVKAPVFILSSVRSGSTLLRVLLGSHSELHAPHELHLSNLRVRLRTYNTQKSMAEIGLDKRGLEHLLWDRLLDRQLRLSGKRTLVNKTPSDVFIWRRILETWPDARFIFLLRHPMSVVESRQASHPEEPLEESMRLTMRFMTAVEEARQALPGPTVRYEQLTADPEGTTKELCTYLGVEWEPGMLEYGSGIEGSFHRGLGDWSKQIRSGEIQPARPLPSPEDVPAPLHDLCRAWGYLPDDETAQVL